jgi:hypothetical protein
MHNWSYNITCLLQDSRSTGKSHYGKGIRVLADIPSQAVTVLMTVVEKTVVEVKLIDVLVGVTASRVLVLTVESLVVLTPLVGVSNVTVEVLTPS